MSLNERIQMAKLAQELEEACGRAIRAALREFLEAHEDVDLSEDAILEVMADIDALRPHEEPAAAKPR